VSIRIRDDPTFAYGDGSRAGADPSGYGRSSGCQLDDALDVAPVDTEFASYGALAMTGVVPGSAADRKNES
jgi:hypothetical protein